MGKTCCNYPRIGHRTLVEGRRGMHLLKCNKFCPLPRGDMPSGGEIGRQDASIRAGEIQDRIYMHRGRKVQRHGALLDLQTREPSFTLHSLP